MAFQGLKQRSAARWLMLALALWLPLATSAQTATVPLTADEQAWVAAHPVIRLASDPVWAPVDFLDAQGMHQGMTADYVALLNRKLGLDMRWEQAEMPWAEVLKAAQDRRIDVIPTAGKRPEREQYLIFTEPPYVSFRSVIVVRNDAPFVSGMGDLAAERIALVPGYAETADFSSRYPDHQVVSAATVEDALTAVATGRANATVGNLAVVNWVIRTKALTNLRIAALYSDEERSVHLAVRKDWPELVAILNKGLAAITPEEHARIRNRWYEVEAQKGLDPAKVWAIAGGLLLLVLLIAVVLTLWLRRLRHEVAERTRSEARAEAAEKRLREITDALPGMVYQVLIAPDMSSRVSMVSDGVQALFGKTRDEVMGQQDVLSSLIHPEDRVRVQKRFMEIVKSGEPGHFDYRTLAADGRYRWIRSFAGATLGEDGYLAWNGFSLDVTAEVEAREKLDAAERLLRDVTDGFPGAIFQRRLALNGEITYPFISAGYERLGKFQVAKTGYADQAEEFEAFPPEERAAIDAARQRSIETLEPYAIDNRMYLQGGGFIWVRTSATPRREPDGTIVWNGYSYDITQRKETEARLEAAEKLLREVTDNAPGFFFQLQFDEAGNRRYSFISRGVLALTGYSAEEFMADPNRLLEATDAEGRERLLGAWGKSRDELAPYRVEYCIRTRSGAQRWLRGSATPSRSANGTMIWNGFTIDVSDEKQLEEELAEAMQVAEAANRAKSEFLANMSHEIRTPMNAIVGLSHLGLKTTAPARLQDYLRKIHTAAQSLLEIINSILDYSKIEAGMLSLEQTSFDLYEVLENISGLLNLRASEKGLELLISVAPEVPPTLIGDPLRLGQVLLNLTGNALKFTERGQIVISVGIASQTEGRIQLRFEVADSGIGMNAAQLGRLFTAFSQADSSTTRQYGGTGLGLSISKRLVELMGGEIGATAEPGVGSVFHFTADFGVAEVVTPPLAAPADLRNLRVLAVDDNFTALDILRTYLESFGLRVDRANSGAQAISAVQREAASDPYQLVLMDWQMPGMNGIEAALQIRDDHAETAPKIVMVSAYGREELMRQAEDAGVEGFLIKPVNPSLLFDTILHAFGKEAALVATAASERDSNLSALPDGTRVLVVEDHEVNQEVARDLLESFGCDVTLAGDGKLGVAAAAAQDFDVILMDLQMPTMDGFEATRIIRALDSPRAGVPIIAMTANAMSEDRQRCLAAGMNDHVGKPVDHRQLLATLIKWAPQRGGAVSNTLQAVAPSAAGAPYLPDSTHFDFAAAESRLGNNPALLRKLMRRFLESPDSLVKLAAQRAAADRAGAVITAHSLRGMAGTLGAVALEDIAQQLEKTLKAGTETETEMTLLAARHAEAIETFNALLAAA